MAVSNDAELEQFILSHCTMPGCRVEVIGHDVLVHTPPITQDTELIVLHDEDEALMLGRLLKDKRLLVRAEAQTARLTTFSLVRQSA
jgi:hypothetical protein